MRGRHCLKVEWEAQRIEAKNELTMGGKSAGTIASRDGVETHAPVRVMLGWQGIGSGTGGVREGEKGGRLSSGPFPKQWAGMVVKRRFFSSQSKNLNVDPKTRSKMSIDLLVLYFHYF